MPADEANPIYLSEHESCDLEALVRQQACARHSVIIPTVIIPIASVFLAT